MPAMSEISTKKDDKATQEMLSMMGDISSDLSDSLDDLDSFDADDLLNALEDLPGELEKEAEAERT